MKIEAQEVAPKAKPPWGVRLRSWKWWVYGDMNSQPREKAPKGFKVQLIIGFTLWIFIGVHPWMSTWLNSEVPNRAAMQVMAGKIVKTARKAPHIYLQLADGTVKSLEFPVFLNNLGGTTYGVQTSPFWGDHYQELLDCNARVLATIPQYTLWERYRVWAVQCTDSGLDANDVLRPDFELFGRGILVFLILPIGFFIIFIRMRRGYYE